MKSTHIFLFASATLIALTGAQPSTARNTARNLVVAQQTPSDNARDAAEKAKRSKTVELAKLIYGPRSKKTRQIKQIMGAK